MHDKSYVPFTKAMRKDYTILIPNMLPIHFRMIVSVFRTYGLRAELLETSGPRIAETGLKYCHNDACYPAVLVIGQFMDALLSGKYDLEHTALMMFQTGGGCRASNYISLIRKALARAGLSHIPVISFSFAGLEDHPGFRVTPHMIRALVYALLYGDLLMCLGNRTRPYELRSGDADGLAAAWTARLAKELGVGGSISAGRVRNNYRAICRDYAAVPVLRVPKVKVGVVGEIFVKYSPLANNDLERFLLAEGAEPVVPGLIDFCLYVVRNMLVDYRLYRKGAALYPVAVWIYGFLCGKRSEVSDAMRESGYEPWTPFPEVAAMTRGYISDGVKMGEGWLLTAEMLELAHGGCKNIVCAQPFGCLPNHICGKGVMKPIMERNPDVNIVAVDYDAGASRVNQENRLKLMLFNARRNAGLPAAPAPAVMPETQPAAFAAGGR